MVTVVGARGESGNPGGTSSCAQAKGSTEMRRGHGRSRLYHGVNLHISWFKYVKIEFLDSHNMLHLIAGIVTYPSFMSPTIPPWRGSSLPSSSFFEGLVLGIATHLVCPILGAKFALNDVEKPWGETRVWKMMFQNSTL